MSADLVLVYIFGGAFLLLYGMRLAGEGMQSLAGGRLRQMLSTLTNRRVTAAASGAVATALLQSSSATTVMLVGLASSGYLGLEQTLGVILGADVGTTLTVQLIAFNILDWAVGLIGLGALLFLAGRRGYRYLGQAVLGFGLIFLAMKIMGDAVAPSRQDPLFLEILQNLSASPLLTIILAAAFTAVIQTSAATIGMALVLANQGVLDLNLAVPIVLGANIGTSATALLSSIGAPAEARRVAVAHLLFKVLGVVLLYPFLPVFGDLVSRSAPDLARQIANSHTIFNLGLVFLFLPFTTPFARLLRSLVPEEKEKEAFGPKYLDNRSLETPALAFGQARREALRIADIAESMVEDSLRVLKYNDEELLEEIRRRDDRIDLLTTEVKKFLTQLAEHDLTAELSRQEIGLLYVMGDLEHIGDTVDLGLMDLAKKKIERGAEFSKEGMAEIEDLHGKVTENLELAVAAFTAQDRDLAEKVLRHKVRINQIERELRQAHIQRLHAGLRESIETSAIHLDVINDLKRINSHATNIAYVVLGEI